MLSLIMSDALFFHIRCSLSSCLRLSALSLLIISGICCRLLSVYWILQDLINTKYRQDRRITRRRFRSGGTMPRTVSSKSIIGVTSRISLSSPKCHPTRHVKRKKKVAYDRLARGHIPQYYYTTGIHTKADCSFIFIFIPTTYYLKYQRSKRE
ncbi:hypothetical protein V8C44DRAFT_334753 [Trichoderma aethiopicum]